MRKLMHALVLVTGVAVLGSAAPGLAGNPDGASSSARPESGAAATVQVSAASGCVTQDAAPLDPVEAASRVDDISKLPPSVVRRLVAERARELLTNRPVIRAPQTLTRATPSGDRVAPAPSLAAAPARAAEPDTTNDVTVFNPHGGFATALRRITVPMAGANDYYAIRATTSQLARQLPFDVDGLWFFTDEFCTWSTGWRFSTVAENTLTGYVPNLSTVVAGPTNFSNASLPGYGTQGPGPSCLRQVAVKIDFTDTTYPANLVLAVNDRSHDDAFDRAPSTLVSTNNWIECDAAPGSGLPRCPAATDALQTNGTVLNASAGTRFAWRVPDPNVCATGVCPPRYLRDIIEGTLADTRYGDATNPGTFLFPWYNPDQDVRIGADYNMSAGNATGAGLFFRANFDGASLLFDYYAAVLTKTGGNLTLSITATDGLGATTTLAGPAPVAAMSGRLEVDVVGYFPVVITARVDGTQVLQYTDSSVTSATVSRPYRGSVDFGNIFGLFFPGATGGETLDAFRVNRNADLFMTAKMPAGDDAFLFADGNEMGREFFNTFVSQDGNAWAPNTTVGCAGATCVDCTRSRNTMLSLQVKEPRTTPPLPAGAHSLFQTNMAMTALELPCCSCLTIPFACATGLDLIDTCVPAMQFIRPSYEVGKPIDITPVFYNEHAPDVPRPCLDPASINRFATFWLACRDNDPTCLTSPCTQGTNCDIMAFKLGPWNAVPPATPGIPGQNWTTVNDTSGDGFPDPSIALQPGTPDTYTPLAAGNYHVYVFELHDIGTGDPTTDCDGLFFDYVADDYPFNGFVTRPFAITNCTSPAYNFSKNSLRLAKQGRCTVAGDVEAAWLFQAPPIDPSTPFNLHEIIGRALLETSCSPPPATCNPYPAATLKTSFTGPPNPPANGCFTPAAVTNDVLFYSLHQADCGTSLADQ